MDLYLQQNKCVVQIIEKFRGIVYQFKKKDKIKFLNFRNF